VKAESVKRRYDASRRQAQARQLRLDVAEAARDLFIAQGFAATTVGDVASAAGVSQPFIYAAFGSKRGLLAKVVDWTIVGDDQPIPMAERPSILAVRQETTITGKIALYAHHGRLVAPRVAPLVRMLRAAADADPDAREIYQTGETQRRTGAAQFIANLRTAGPLRAGLSDQHAADAVWALAPDILWTSLVDHQGWSANHFEQWYAAQLGAAVLEPRQLAAVHKFSQRIVAHYAPDH
jgi:AcrR family transcriptional regulator